jgi:hypothetical protein
VVNSPIASTTGTVQIATGLVAGPTAENVWEFDANGTLTFPDNTVQTTAYTGVVRQDTAPTAANGTLWFNTVEGRLYIKYSDAWVDAAPLVQPPPDTDLDVVSITFPDATVQTTAYTGGRVVADLVPANSTGAAGDAAGSIAVGGGYLYVCTANWASPGTANIWTRTLLTTGAW